MSRRLAMGYKSGRWSPDNPPGNPDAFAFYDPAQKAWVAEAGEFRVRVGSSSRLVRLEVPFTLKANLEVTG